MIDEAHSNINYPVWTEYRKKNGLDSLGMQNSSVSLYQTFLPGISNVTLRMRYYGLYAWLCRTYARKVGDTNPESWKRFIRRTEALYALIAYRHGNQGGVAGIEWAQKATDASKGGTIEFAAAAEPGSENYYLKQAWGAYGAAYRSQLFEIGIFDTSADHDLPMPSKEIGERLADAFENSIGDLAPLCFEIVQRGSVTDEELDALFPLVPSEIALTGEERELYQDILLKPFDPLDTRARSRQSSILLILKIAALLGRDPKPEEVRWILFAGCDQEGRKLDMGSPALEAQRYLWWVYHANDLCHIAFETLLKFTLDTLAEFPAGIELSRLIPLCVEKILAAAPSTPDHWTGFIGSLTITANAYAADDDDSEFLLSEGIMKRAGRGDASICEQETAWNAIRLLATLHRRLSDEGHDVAIVLNRFNPDAFRSLLTETRFLDAHSHEPFAGLLAQILEVVCPHWVARFKSNALSGGLRRLALPVKRVRVA